MSGMIDKILNYIYLIPLILAMVFVVMYFAKRINMYKKALNSRLSNNGQQRFTAYIIKKLIPEDSAIYRFYSSVLLKYSNIKIESLFTLKAALFVITILLSLLIKYTNIVLQTREILTLYDYKTDFIYKISEAVDKSEVFEKETGYLAEVIKTITRSDLSDGEAVQLKIRDLIRKSKAELPIPVESMANRIYHRIRDYYSIREVNITDYILAGLMSSFIPEIYLLIAGFFRKADAKRELRFLKKLLILNGSIKPVDFLSVLKVLIRKSKYYKSILIEIEECNRLNSANNKEIYTNRIKNTKDLDEKLFFEKLDEANNYDFDQAIRNIENEFRLERRDQARKVRKRIEVIHLSGMLGAMVIIMLMVIYLILPWMELYSMSQMGF